VAARAIAFTGLAALVAPGWRLLELLQPALREQVFEAEDCDDDCSLCVAPRSGVGRLEFLDIQRNFLEDAMRTAADNGLSKVVPSVGDAHSLPYEDESLDEAFLVSVLGEIPDQAAAMRELHRALRPGGALIVGETAPGNPRCLTMRRLRKRAGDAGFQFERSLASPLGHFTRFARA
jgi:SAM-dependent methyltransferase